ncbi:hypothetical protein [Pseudoxanthomonas mexicana]|uniref:hypothetical protein n=1 Tax=Pseudoxanthomonas mexicana TaxID=128785 RepID=UPI001E30689D|nr:hypothetical protein [Pseudoxanthomonas mexicana]
MNWWRIASTMRHLHGIEVLRQATRRGSVIANVVVPSSERAVTSPPCAVAI